MARSRYFRPPRRLRIHRAGWTVIIGALGLGLAAMATGNNLLYLILGGMLGLIALSGWLSEVTLRGVSVTRRVPRGVEAGTPAHIAYELANRKRLLPSFALEVGERHDAERGFLAAVAAGESATVRVQRLWERRGVHPLATVTLATSFPFGLFRKERDVEVPGEVVVWPRTDRAVRTPRPTGDRRQRSGEAAAGAAGARGEYRSLRGYLPGDDPRDVHWRSSARAGAPVVREYAREQARTLWLCLDLGEGRGPGGDLQPESATGGEAAIEIAAALAARAIAGGQPVGLATQDQRIEPGTGTSHLERVLDALARARLRPGAALPRPPVEAESCVLVTAGSGAGAAWGDVVSAGDP